MIRIEMQFHRTVPGGSSNGKQFPDEKEVLILEGTVEKGEQIPAFVMKLSEARFQATKMRIEKAKAAKSTYHSPASSGPIDDDDVPF